MFIVEMKDGRARTVIPANLVLDPPPGLDEQLASDLQEAVACFNVQAYKGSVVMVRRFLEAFLDKRGFKGRTLAERIKTAHTSGAISDVVFHFATSARILGNYGRTIPTISWLHSEPMRLNLFSTFFGKY
jgi:hypothetical protein